MEISFNSKFNLGDKICFISHVTTRIFEATVTEIKFDISNEGSRIYYKTEPYSFVNETECFASKEELISQLNS